jgi:hypothetical protein
MRSISTKKPKSKVPAEVRREPTMIEEQEINTHVGNERVFNSSTELFDFSVYRVFDPERQNFIGVWDAN